MRVAGACFLISFALLLAGCDQTVTKTEPSPSAAGSEQAAASASDSAADHFLIDVRSQGEWDGGHVETAIHIPHTDIVEGIKKVTTDKSAKIHLY